VKQSIALRVFFFRAVGGFLLATLVWVPLSPWTSYPAAGLAHVVLGNGARDWVRSIEKSPGRLEVETRVRVAGAEGGVANQHAELVAEANPARYAYGLPLFMALLFAARSRHWLRRALGGYLLLLIPQSFSLTVDILRQILVVGGGAAALGVAPWQLEAIALGYQVGSLLLPTLAPVMLWLWLDRAFFAAVIVDGWLRREVQ
jgi:hypothetical protein